MKRGPKLRCRPDGQRLQILNATGTAELGYIELPCESYTVRTPEGELVAVAHSIEDALAALGYGSEELSMAD